MWGGRGRAILAWEVFYLQQSLDPGSRCETNPHSPPASLCRIQLPFTCPSLGGQPCQSLGVQDLLVTCSVLSPVL